MSTEKKHSKKPELFIHPEVAGVRSLHEEVLKNFSLDHSMYDLLSELAENLHRASQSGDERSLVEIKNYLSPEELAGSVEQIKINEANAREIMARQHGFQDWQEVKYGGNTILMPDFENAVDAVIGGELGILNSLLNDMPHLTIQRSAYFHKATLLHYATANGIEIRRQIVPENLPQIVHLLLAKGADPGARGYFYGKMVDMKTLLISGSHVREAGLYEEIIKLI